MTNREYYKEEIEEIVYEEGDCIGIDKNGKPVACSNIDCDGCQFIAYESNCYKNRIEWFNQEYVEPPIDWSKIPVDTKILVRDSKNEEWKRRHFATYENGKVYTFCNSLTSWTIQDMCDYYYDAWEYAKLAKEEE